MKWTLAIIYTTAVINLGASSALVGLMWLGWGQEWLVERLGELFLMIFTSSVLLVVALTMVSMRVVKENSGIKRRRRVKAEKLSLSRSFLKEAVERDLNKLKPKEMKAFIVDYVLSTQEMINKSTELGNKSIALWEQTQGVIDSLSSRVDSGDNQRKK